ncbi:MAG: protein translocase subunit SecD [Oscillospiraceae bacterium]|nr:protein translocase subunit SecD [Oscillospiraceae bacterium]
MKPKTKGILTFAVLILIIALLIFSWFFGLNLGFLKIDPVKTGITFGLDLVGGSEITYEAEGTESLGAAELAEGMETAITMLRQRLNTLGYTEANVYKQGTSRIVCEIPNVEDPEEAVQMLGTTAVIEFRDCDGNVVIDGSDIESASANYSAIDETGVSTYHVILKLNKTGAEKFKEATKIVASRANEADRYVAIVMDETVISRPFVDQKYAATGLDTDTPIITLGNDASLEYAKYLAEIISAGKLPFALREAKLQAVGASLGERSLETAVMAGVIGIILVMLYMIIVYRVPGVIADISLLLYMALFLVLLSAFHINLSLPGIAGIILTIGMAVDANIVIYERIREEILSGKTMRSAVDTGFKRALAAMLDSNITTIIAAGVLLWKGTGTILGFGKTLLIGVILSMICMLIIPRLLLRRLVDMRVVKPKYYGIGMTKTEEISEPKKIPVIRRFKITGVIAIICCIAAVVALVALPFGATFFNLDQDFVGGVTMNVDIGQPFSDDTASDIRGIVADVTGSQPFSVTKAGNRGTQASIRMGEVPSEQRDAIFEAMKAKFGETVTLESSDFVSASVGKDITKSAFLASIIAAALILIYITIRFEFRSGLAAVICLIQNLLVMISVYVIFRMPLNMNFIAAALTIIGYSINTTIVVFDRIRENVKKSAGGSFKEIVDISVHQTMRRSIGTTITTLLPVILIIIFGVPSIRNFAIPIAVGVIAGTFSSVFIAGPLWSAMRGKKAIKAK